ncbi:FAST kinase domain-containing protein 4 [Pseudophryne corroboree]|uniref:FAST kinase domain-containing protein 4 n=1 Tax=Pseudophryne corroboree TaxID=495146 RepID=UPI0030819B68
MAARLIQRFSRVLALTSSLQPQFSSALSECARVCHQTLAMPPRLCLHTSSLFRHTDNLAALDQSFGVSEDKEFVSMLNSASGVEELLRLSTEPEITCYKATLIIQQISKMHIANRNRLSDDKRFQKLLNIVNKQIRSIWNRKLVALLRSLYTIGLDAENWYLRSVETEVQWRLRRFNIETLAQLASFLVPRAETTVQKDLVLDLLKNVELRWTEIKDTRTLVTLINRLSSMSQTLLERLEDKILEFAEIFTPEETRSVIVALAAQNLRSLPILRALSFHLVQHSKELCPSVILDLVFAYALLGFHQPQVFQRMVADLLPKVSELCSKDLVRCMRSFATLRFSSLPLCEAVAQVCTDQNEALSVTQLSNIVIAFAHLNFQPSKQEEFFSIVHQRLSGELDSLSPTILVDLVYSLCILQHVTLAHIQKALDPQVSAQILGDCSSKSYSLWYRKLMQINAAAQLEVPDYQGPSVSPDVKQPETNKSLSRLESDLQSVLRELFPEEETCHYNSHTVYGCDIDGEFALDVENKPLFLRDLGNPHILHCKGTNPLPEGAKRFAVKSWNLSNYNLRSKELVGWSAMCRRHLQAAGFLLVEVPFYEWQELKSQWQKSAFLKEQMKKAAAAEEASL